MSIVRDRGRAFGVVAALTASVALASVPTALGAVDGDPINTSTDTFKIKLSGGFKKQLKSNGVKMKPTKLKLTKGDVDPTTGKADLSLGKITFKKGKEKVVYSNVKGSVPGNFKGSSGKLFKLTAATVARNGFGADLSGIKVKFLKAAAKKINKKLVLNSLHMGSVGNMSLSYQPQTVKVIGGTAQTSSVPPGDPGFGNSVGIKFISHCVLGSTDGITPIEPATKQVLGAFGPIVFRFPVVDGDISPLGTDGFTQQAGGLRIKKNINTGGCNNGLNGELTQVEIITNITDKNVSSVVDILAAPPSVLAGPKGRAINQAIDPTNTVVNADPVNRTITLSGSVIQLAAVSALTLNGVFPNTSGTPANDFNGGDVFGTSILTVQVR